jgi:hypothetical protein
LTHKDVRNGQVTRNCNIHVLLRVALFIATFGYANSSFPGLLKLVQGGMVDKATKFVYNHPRYFGGALFALSSCLLQSQLDRIAQSPYFSILMDSSTDVSTSDCVLLYVQYAVITDACVQIMTEFLCLLPLADDKSGDAHL